MAFSSFEGPLRSGTVRNGTVATGRNTGLATLYQEYNSGDLTGVAVGNVDTAAFVLPQGSRIVDIVVDQITAAGTGTTTVSVGTTSGGAELMAAVATTAGGRFRGTATAATQSAWSLSTTADSTIYVRVAVATATLTAGRFIVTILYAQRSPAGLTNPTSV